MNSIYNNVPNIITGKDLDYLSDMFEWNYGALKVTNDSINKVNNEEIKELLENSTNIFKSNLDITLNILRGNNE